MKEKNMKQEFSELLSAILRVVNDFRGKVNGMDLYQFVLGILLYRFISENICSYVNCTVIEVENRNFNYAELNDSEAESFRTTILEEKGFFLLPSELFENVRKHSESDGRLSEILGIVFKNIENSAHGTINESKMNGLFDKLNFNSIMLGETIAECNEKLAKLLNSIGELPIGKYENSNKKPYGDIFEYLIDNFAANAGKLGSDFFTPQDVSELLVRITLVGKKEINKVYDPACGSGSLLLKFAEVLGKNNIHNGLFGQDISEKAYKLCRINMFLHEINIKHFDIFHGDTLTSPQFRNIEPFDAIVSNPPYSIDWDANPNLINDSRYSPAKVLAPKSKADLAFVMHALSWLGTNGTAAIVMYPGVLIRGGLERKIRKYLIDNNFVDAVIQLTTNLFYGISIAYCILVLKKNKSDNKVMFIDAKNELICDPKTNKLYRGQKNVVLECYEKRETLVHFSRLVDNNEIVDKDYNISVGEFVELEGTGDKVDICELHEMAEKSVVRQSGLRMQIDAIIADLEGVAT